MADADGPAGAVEEEQLIEFEASDEEEVMGMGNQGEFAVPAARNEKRNKIW
jgi:hypothetical protein